jgi:hypothetical protein
LDHGLLDRDAQTVFAAAFVAVRRKYLIAVPRPMTAAPRRY